MQFKIYKLHFTTPLHLGDVRDDYSVSLKTVASDTMYAALISTLAKMGESIPDKGVLKCTISSLFPFYQKEKGDQNVVLFLPKPMKQQLPTTQKAFDARKKIKKVTWFDSDYFSMAINGKTLFNDDSAINDIKGDFLSSKTIDKDFVSSQISQRVSVSRNSSEDAKPFFMDRIVFRDYSGLYFIADGDTSSLEKALNLLQHEGIGTDRNVGNGYFEYDLGTLTIDMPDNADYEMSLSSFIPESKEQLSTMIDGQNVAYDFQRRGGWITTPPHNTYRKNVIHAFTAGSVFKSCNNGITIKGKTVDLKPQIIDHPVWRCGRALFLPIKLS